MITCIKTFIERHEWLIPLSLAVSFVLMTIPGIEWGVPAGWNPDELIQRVQKALDGKWVFDESNFDYPSLPKYVMFWLGRLIESWGLGPGEVMLAARKLSVQIGAGIVVLAYAIARKLGASLWAAGLAGLIVLTNSELAQHARFAHNDIYVAFFVALAVLISIRIIENEGRRDFYLSAFIVGLAASSKYNGGIMILLPIGLLILREGKEIWRKWAYLAESIGLAGLFSFLGYALGTPKALFWMAFYFKRLIPALQGHVNYGYQPGRELGLFGQWSVWPNVLGTTLAWVALGLLATLLYSAWKCWKDGNQSGAMKFLTIPAAILIFDIPIAFSFNYPERFILPMVALIAAGVALASDNLWYWVKDRGHAWVRWVGAAGLALVLILSLVRTISVRLLFQNDARIPASEYLAELPPAESIEYTLYPPTLVRGNFERAHNYPIFFLSEVGQIIPEGKIYDFNTGVAGLADRGTQYLVIDSFTYERFENDHRCEVNSEECAFFKALLAGETVFEEIALFQYELPDWLPKWHLSFMNPDIRIFERAE